MTYRKENVLVAVIEVTRCSTWEENLTRKCNEYASMGSPKYVILPSEGAGTESESCVFVGSMEHRCGQAVDEMIGSGVEGVGRRVLCQSRTRKIAERFYYRSVFREDEVVEWSEVEELELKAKKIMRWKAVCQKLTSYDAAQRKIVAKLERKM